MHAVLNATRTHPIFSVRIGAALDQKTHTLSVAIHNGVYQRRPPVL